MIWQIGSGAELGWSPAIFAEIEAAKCDERPATVCSVRTAGNQGDEGVVVPAERGLAVFRGVSTAV